MKVHVVRSRNWAKRQWTILCRHWLCTCFGQGRRLVRKRSERSLPQQRRRPEIASFSRPQRYTSFHPFPGHLKTTWPLATTTPVWTKVTPTTLMILFRTVSTTAIETACGAPTKHCPSPVARDPTPSWIQISCSSFISSFHCLSFHSSPCLW